MHVGNEAHKCETNIGRQVRGSYLALKPRADIDISPKQGFQSVADIEFPCWCGEQGKAIICPLFFKTDMKMKKTWTKGN